MFSPIRIGFLTGCLLLAATVAQPAAISVNGTCEMGNCSTPDALDLGGSTNGTFSYIYTFGNTDRYSITGNYSASYAGATSIGFNVIANYIGNSSNSASSADTLSVDLLQDYNYQGDPNGTYSVTTTLTQDGNAPGSYTEAQLSYNGQGLGLMGPYFGPGSQSFSASKALSGLTAPLAADFNYTFFFAAGSPAVPEPAEVGLLMCGFIAVLLPALRRRKQMAD